MKAAASHSRLRKSVFRNTTQSEKEYFRMHRTAVAGDTSVSCHPARKLGARVGRAACERAIRAVAHGAFAQLGSERDGRL